MPMISKTLPRPQRVPLRISTDIPLFSFNSSSDSSSLSDMGSISSSVKTPGTSSAQFLCHVMCMHDFDSSDPVHLPFHKDELLAIVKQERSGWWAAMRPQGDRIGWIPSSFVMPLNKRKIMGHSDGTLVHPLSAVHSPWVPVCDEGIKVFTFELVTPTDPSPYEDVFDGTERRHNDESLLNLSNRYHKPSSVMDVPLTPGSSSPSLFPSESGMSELTWTAGSLLRDAGSFFHPRTHIVGD